MAIVIYKRTRAVATDPWGAWAETTDIPPYEDTDLVEYTVKGSTNIDISKFTNGEIDGEGTQNDPYEWVGTGVFDIVMKAVNGNVQTEFYNGRIDGGDYATVYLGAIQSALATAEKILLSEPQVEAKTDVSIEQKRLLEKQQALTERQTKGFDDDAKQKLLKQTLDSWSVAYSVAQDANSIPDTIKVNVIDSIMKDAYTALGVSVTNDPIGEI